MKIESSPQTRDVHTYTRPRIDTQCEARTDAPWLISDDENGVISVMMHIPQKRPAPSSQPPAETVIIPIEHQPGRSTLTNQDHHGVTEYRRWEQGGTVEAKEKRDCGLGPFTALHFSNRRWQKNLNTT